MSNIAIDFEHVWKKFKRGELHDSLRDLVPAISKRLLSRRPENGLGQREFWALQDVSLQVHPGEALGIIGPNGAGKSTILKLLSGILKPTKGQLQVNGRLSALIEVGAGFHPDLTGRENIYLNGTILGMRRAEIVRKLDQIVEFAGLEDALDTPVKRYSSGMYARLGFSVAVHVEPEILLIDEVLSVGDMSFQERCLEKMQEKVTSGVAVVFVSHNLQAVTTLCKRCLVLAKGNKVYDGPSEVALRAYLEAVKKIGPMDAEPHPKVRLLSVRWLEPEDTDTPMLHPHAPCKLMAKFECLEDGPSFCAGFVIKRMRDLLYCYGATTEELEQPFIPCKRGAVFTLVYRFVNHFSRGHYRIDLNLRDPKGAVFLSQVDGIASFTVDERISYDGVVDVDLGVEIQQG